MEPLLPQPHMIAALLLCACMPFAEPVSTPLDIATDWRLALDSPGGELPFGLEFQVEDSVLTARVINGEERLQVGEVKLDGRNLVLRLDPYDSYLYLHLAEDGQSLTGRWEKFTAKNRKARLDVRGRAGKQARFPLTPVDEAQRERLDGRWAVQFATDESIAVGHFKTFADGRAEGTFETTLGDYRFLAGSFDGQRLRLSCFDGGHAFLFDARLDDQGELAGGFWSRDSWHENWTAKKDSNVKLPDPFGLSAWTGAVPLADLVFPDLFKMSRSLADPDFSGKARIITLFGTWCPNCNDEGKFLAELAGRYGERGLSILGLAFELDDDFERSKVQIERFSSRHSVTYPILVAGTADKELASKAFPALDRVRAFPTAIFLDRTGAVRAIHTGFSGPATGRSHEHMRERYELLIEELLRDTDGQ